MKKSTHPITPVVERYLENQVAQASLTVPNDGLKYELNISPEQGTASWSHSKLGHNITLYDFHHTLDSSTFLTRNKTRQATMIRDYASMMVVHEQKGHGALSTRELGAMGSWCNDNRIHPDLLNIMEDIRIESALSAKRPGHTKSKGVWINHLGMFVDIPTRAEGGDYGWRKAYWHRYNKMPDPHMAPEAYLSALCWAERIRTLETKVHKRWLDECASKGLDVNRWGTEKAKNIQRFIDYIFRECRAWRKYRTTESLKSLLLEWVKFFPCAPEGASRVSGHNDVIVNMMESGCPLVDPYGNPLDDATPCIPTSSPTTAKKPTEPTPTPEPVVPTNPKESPKDDAEGDEKPATAEHKGEHEKLSDSKSGDEDLSHDEQDIDIGDGASSVLSHETHTVGERIQIDLPSWVSDFAKRDSDFGSSNEKLPADFF